MFFSAFRICRDRHLCIIWYRKSKSSIRQFGRNFERVYFQKHCSDSLRFDSIPPHPPHTHTDAGKLFCDVFCLVFAGRFINFGTSKGHPRRQGMTAFDSARHAVVGASESLREDIKDLGVHVIVVNTNQIQPENLFEPVRSSCSSTLNEMLLRSALPEYAVHTMLDALLDPRPKPVYAFEKPSRFSCGFSNKILKPERYVGYENI